MRNELFIPSIFPSQEKNLAAVAKPAQSGKVEITFPKPSEIRKLSREIDAHENFPNAQQHTALHLQQLVEDGAMSLAEARRFDRAMFKGYNISDPNGKMYLTSMRSAQNVKAQLSVSRGASAVAQNNAARVSAWTNALQAMVDFLVPNR